MDQQHLSMRSYDHPVRRYDRLSGAIPQDRVPPKVTDFEKEQANEMEVSPPPAS